MGHCRFLPLDHRFRTQKKSFDGTIEGRKAPKPLSGSKILNELEGTKHIFGKQSQRMRSRHTDDDKMPFNWKKKSIFFELPYWENNLIRHSLDVMHIEKHICDNIIGTLLNLE